jgi:hypothetical protein
MFALVLEPHYMLEVLMYFLLVTMNLRSVIADQDLDNRREMGRLFAIFYPGMLTFMVALFTFINLSMTAAEHRAYWNSLQATACVRIPKWNVLPGVF